MRYIEGVNLSKLNKSPSFTEVKNAVDAFKNGKAVGHDLLPNELLKNGCCHQIIA